MKKISISIVLYNSTGDIDKVMSAIEKCTSLPDSRVFVIDNASSDGGADYVREKYPFADVRVLPENIGFGKGHNTVLGELDSKYHLIVNPDISFEPDLIEKMARFMDENPETVILTPKVFGDDGNEQFLPKKFGYPKYLIGSRLEKFGGIFEKLRSEYTMRGVSVTEPIITDHCTGCFMFCRTDALKSCGGFDSRYFLYFEDADLTLKMQKLGKTVYAPQFSVTHSWKRENGKSLKGISIAAVSAAKFLWKWRREGRARRGK